MRAWDYESHQYRDMAVEGGGRLSVAAAPSYIGLSTEDKPYPAYLPTGRTFYESDTGRVFAWDGANWRLQEDRAVVEQLGLLLLELRQIRLIVEAVTS